MARLAAFDMDGTLLMPDHHLGRETIATLARLRERDITLTFATGRHVLEMRHILGTLSLDAYLITGNGTRIHSLEGDVLQRRAGAHYGQCHAAAYRRAATPFGYRTLW